MDDFPWRKNYDQGVPHNLDYPQQPIFGFLEEVARDNPDLICTVF